MRCKRIMGDDEGRGSPDLDRACQILFPDLSLEDGRARIEKALVRASDAERIERIEREAKPLEGRVAETPEDELLLVLERLVAKDDL